MIEPIFTVSQAVAVINQSLDMLYPTIRIVGELSQFKIAKGKWLYADIKDEEAKLRLFGTVFQLPGPLEDGMAVEVVGEPRLHPSFGFTLTIRSIRPVGEGSIKKAANLLEAQLEREGLFAVERKRAISPRLSRIGLIASVESAAYADFIKVLNARWLDVTVEVYNVAVQGETAVESIVQAISYFNMQPEAVELLVVTRGGGSADDLSAFSSEQVTRAVAASRIPTCVAVGHETDVSLAERAADLRASTPSNAAELLFPDKGVRGDELMALRSYASRIALEKIEAKRLALKQLEADMTANVSVILDSKQTYIDTARSLLASYHPTAALNRGFALITRAGKILYGVDGVAVGDGLTIAMRDGEINATVVSSRRGKVQ